MIKKFPLLILIIGVAGVSGISACDDSADESAGSKSEDHFARAESSLEKGDIRDALVELKNAAQEESRDAESRLLLGEVYTRLGDGVSAEKELLRASELGIDADRLIEPMGQALLLQGRYQEVLDEYQDQTEYSSERKSKILVLRGRANLGLQRENEATAAFEKALEIDSRSIDAIVGLGRIALGKQRLEDARALLQRAREIAPDDPDVHSLVGSISAVTGDFAASEAAFWRELELRPHSFVPLLGIARAQLAAGKLGDATINIDRVLEIVPGHIYGNYLRSAAAYSDGDYGLAEAMAGTALKSAPEHTLSLMIRGAARFAQKKFSEAEHDLRAVVAAAPRDATARKLLAMTQLRLGEPQEAIMTALPALAQERDSIEIFRLIGTAAEQKGDVAMARHYFEQADLKAREIATEGKRIDPSRFIFGDANKEISELSDAIRAQEGRTRSELDIIAEHLAWGRAKDAAAAAQRFRGRHPENPFSWTLEALAHLGLGERDLALDTLRRALQLSPGETEASHVLARLAMEDSDINTARELYEEALDHNPGHVPTLMRFANLEARAGDRKAEKHLLRQAIESDPEVTAPRVILGRILVEEGDWESAMWIAEKGMLSSPQSVALLEVVGKAYLTSGEADKAIESIRRFTEQFPNSDDARYLLAKTYFRIADFKRAKETLDALNARGSEHLRGRLLRARIALDENDLNTAGDLATDLYGVASDDPDVADLMGDYAIRMRSYSLAVKAFTRKFERQPTTDTIHKLAEAQWLAGEPVAAVDSLTNWLEKHPGDQLSLYRLGEYYLRSGDLAAAGEQFRSIVDQYPDDAMARNNLAWTLLKTGKIEEALVQAERANELAPNNAGILDTLGQIHLEAGQAARAVSALLEAANRVPESLGIRFHLAQAYVESGNTNDAVTVLDELLSVRTEFAEREAAEALLADLTSAKN